MKLMRSIRSAMNCRFEMMNTAVGQLTPAKPKSAGHHKCFDSYPHMPLFVLRLVNDSIFSFKLFVPF